MPGRRAACARETRCAAGARRECVVDGEEGAAGPGQGAAALAGEERRHRSVGLANGQDHGVAEPDVSYETSRIKRRRATRAEMNARLEALVAIVAEHRPCTVRQAFYQATVRGVVAKDERGYDKVQRALVTLRRSERIPYSSVTDHTRWRRSPVTFGSVAEALDHTARTYRQAMWREVPVYVEVWCEKDALAGVLAPITSLYDITLMVSRGYSSLSFLYAAAEHIQAIDKPTIIFHFGDWDPSGQNAAQKVADGLREFAPDSLIQFRRLAVRAEQISAWRLPTRPTKASDSRTKRWTGGASVELEAIAAPLLRLLLKREIEALLPERWLETVQVIEESERQGLQAIARAFHAEASGEASAT